MRRVLSGLLAVVALAGCGPPGAPSRNVLLLTLDTTRADALGTYGAPPGHTPHLDRLAAEGVVFEQALTPCPLTLPAHASLLTGHPPLVHHVRNNGSDALPERFPTLATALRDRGYHTAAVLAGLPLDRQFGLARGFERYDDVPHRDDEGDGVERRAGEVFLRARAALESLEEPWFLWVHFFDPHAPYEPSEEARLAAGGDPYAGEVFEVDRAVGSLRNDLEARGSWESTIVVVAGDHGEGLGEHGEQAHGLLLHEATVHVPLLLRGRGMGSAGMRVRTPVSLIDVAPTILDALGLGDPLVASGRSLLPWMRPGAAPEERRVLLETLLPWLQYGWTPLFGIRGPRWKYVLKGPGTGEEWIDLRADPGENHPRSTPPEDDEEARAIPEHFVSRVRDLLWVEADARGQGDAFTAPATPIEFLRALLPAGPSHTPDEEARRGLEQLGYALPTHPTGTPVPNPRTPLPDVRDELPILQAIAGLNELARSGRFEEALAALVPLLDHHPDNEDLWQRRVQLLRRLGHPRDALVAARAAAARLPSVSATMRNLQGLAALESGDTAEALGCFREAVDQEPHRAAFRLGLAAALARQGRIDAALATVREAVRRSPSHARARANLGLLLAEKGEVEAARRTLEKALDLDASIPEALYGLAVLRLRPAARPGAPPPPSGAISTHPADVDAAIDLLDRAMAEDPTYEAAFALKARAILFAGRAAGFLEAVAATTAPDPARVPDLIVAGLLEESLGRPAEAASLYRRALDLDPRLVTARVRLTGLPPEQQEPAPREARSGGD